MVKVSLYLEVPRHQKGSHWKLRWGISPGSSAGGGEEDEFVCRLLLGSHEARTTDEAVEKLRQQIVGLADFMGDESLEIGVVDLVEKPLPIQRQCGERVEDIQTSQMLERDALADRVTFACNYATMNNRVAFSPGVGKRLEEAIRRTKERLW